MPRAALTFDPGEPSPDTRRLPRGIGLFVLCLCLLTGALVSVQLGQDANWDLLNYHLCNPWVALSGRMDVDLLASGLQSYFNPTLDIPYYLVATGPFATRPQWPAAAQGLPYGGLLFVAFCLARRLLPGLTPDCRARTLPWKPSHDRR